MPIAAHARPHLSAHDVFVPRVVDDARDPVIAWAAHVAAGRIGTPAASTPLQDARRRTAEAAMRTGPRHRIW